RRHTRFDCDWSSDVCSSDLIPFVAPGLFGKEEICLIHFAEIRFVPTLFSELEEINRAADCETEIVITKWPPASTGSETLWCRIRSEERRVGKGFRSVWWSLV